MARDERTYGVYPVSALDQPTVEMRQYEEDDSGVKLAVGLTLIVCASAGLVCEWVFNHLFTRLLLDTIFTGWRDVSDIEVLGAIPLTVIYILMFIGGIALMATASVTKPVPKQR